MRAGPGTHPLAAAITLGPRRGPGLCSAAVIREASIDDAVAAAALLAVVTPEFVTSAAVTRHNMATSPPEAQRLWWCVERRRRLVGWANVGLVVETSEAGAGWIGVTVHPDHRKQGIGTALADVAERHARAIRARRLRAWSRADGDTVSFARSRGYEQTASNDMLVVDPRAVTPAEPPPGVELSPLSAFEDDPSPIHHVDSVAFLDEPGDLTLDALSLARWLEHDWSHPLLDREVSVVAAVDGIPAAVTYVQTDRATGRGTNSGTATLPEHRGRGLATLAKRASLVRAAQLGITAVYTGNDVTNAAMQAINRKLGYEPCSTMLSWARNLVEA
jgi:RimJ/RimL family protein N-acetyltransferase